MNSVKYNQFQGIYKANGKNVLLDFLHNKLDVYDDDTIFEYEYNEKYAEKSNKLDYILLKKNNDTLSITIITSLECNMKCLYCYEESMCINNKDISTRIHVKNIINFIKTELSKKTYEMLSINILGGEPLLEKNIEFLEELCTELKLIDQKKNIAVTTNGINVYCYIENIISWGINDIQITLDGTEEVQNKRRSVLDEKLNGFKEIEKGINKLLINKINVFLRVNVDRNNVGNIPDLGKLIIANNWVVQGLKPYIYPVTSSGNPEYVLEDSEIDIFKKVLEVFKNDQEIGNIFKFDFHGIEYIGDILKGTRPKIRTKFCGISKGQYVISSDGTVLNCWWGLEENKFKIGKIEELNYSIDTTKIKSFSVRNTLKIKECNLCKFKYICGGGCTYKEYINKGTVNKGNCSQFDMLIEEYLRYAL